MKFLVDTNVIIDHVCTNTRNQKDFEKSLIKVFDCDELFAYLAEEKGLTYEEMPW